MPKASKVYKYYRYCPLESVYKCIVEENENECKIKINGKYNPCSNLKKHIERHHKKEWAEFNLTAMATTSNLQASSTTESQQEQTSIKKFLRSNQLKITINETSFKLGLIEMVLSGTPLIRFQSPGFLRINGEIAQKLGVGLSRESVRKYVMDEAEINRQELIDGLVGKLLFVKTDAATRMQRIFLGVNKQYFNEKSNSSVIKTLAVSDTENKHKGKEISSLLESVFSRFQINKENVLCVVVDNASNMSKAVGHLNEHEDAEIEADENEDSAVSDPETVLLNIHHMRCGIHTLQLAIRDGLKQPNCERLLTKVRWLVAKLRAPNILAVLEKRTNRRAILDNKTRWGSTYLMLRRLCELKYNVQELGVVSAELHIPYATWSYIEVLTNTLQMPYVITLRLQCEDLTPGEFLKEWFSLKRTLCNLNESVASEIMMSMINRERLLFDNKLFLAGVFVDARYRILLTPEQVSSAKEGLLEVALKQHAEQNSSMTRENENLSPQVTTNSSSEDDFEKELDRLELRNSPVLTEGNQQYNFCNSYNASLDDMLQKGRMKGKVWSLISTFKEPIRSAAYVVTAMPVTQVSVERLFSAMKFIYSDLRSSMKQDLLEAILFMRTNRVLQSS